MEKNNRIEDIRVEDVYPDKTKFYNYEQAKTIFNDIKRTKFTLSDVILILLYSHPEKSIFGKVSLQKQIFLLIKEILDENDVQDPKFIPYRYGMYSFVVGNELINLEYSGYIERRGKKNSKLEQFRITEKGRKNISDGFNSLPETQQEIIKEKRKGWDQLGYDGILRLVYQKYPEYKEESRLKERYKIIEWGRGIG